MIESEDHNMLIRDFKDLEKIEAASNNNLFTTKLITIVVMGFFILAVYKDQSFTGFLLSFFGVCMHLTMFSNFKDFTKTRFVVIYTAGLILMMIGTNVSLINW